MRSFQHLKVLRCKQYDVVNRMINNLGKAFLIWCDSDYQFVPVTVKTPKQMSFKSLFFLYFCE